MAEEASQAEEAIPDLGKKADLKIVNNATLDQFAKKINQLAEKLVY